MLVQGALPQEDRRGGRQGGEGARVQTGGSVPQLHHVLLPRAWPLHTLHLHLLTMYNAFYFAYIKKVSNLTDRSITACLAPSHFQ